MSKTRYDWLVDIQPTQARYTRLGYVTGSINVGMDMEVAGSTPEIRTVSVPFIGMTTSGTLLGRVSGICQGHGLTEGFSFVSDKLLKFVERPGVKFPIEVLPTPSFLHPDLGQVFESEDRIIRVDDLLRDTMINISHKPSFSAAEFTEFPFSGSSAFGLQFFTEMSVFCSYVLHLFRIEKRVVGTDSDVNDPPVNTEHCMFVDIDRSRCRSSDFELDMQVKHAGMFPESEGRRPDLPVEVLPVMVRDIECHRDPAVNSSDSSVPGFRTDADHPLVVPDTGVTVFAQEESDISRL